MNKIFKILIFVIATGLVSCEEETNYSKVDNLHSEATFVGNKSCIECHKAEHNDWLNSDHERAMDTVSVASVVGDFNNSTFTFDGFTSKFYKRDGRYFVFTKGEDGIAKELEIAYTFGIKPLQQYLIPTDNGRLQCLPIAWDVQTNDWYSMVDSLYHDTKIAPDNWLYWTNNGQNWNGMCAECHSTNLHKGYNHNTKKFNTTYSDINVGCESCHGPASKHNAWAEIEEKDRPELDHSGFKKKTYGLNPTEMIDQCGYCHARRTSFGDNPHDAQFFMQHWTPQLLHDVYYHSDGQMLEEDYVVGSFMQSKMFRHNVSCNDCHNPHTLKTKFQGNQLCHQCHIPADYEEKHHFHKKTGGKGDATENGVFDNEKGDGTQCVDCHMPGGNFMGVDYRRDHSIRVPRPDLSIRNGTPNACNQCHKDKTNEWSVETIEKWYGHKLEHENTVMFNAFADARKGDFKAIPILINDVIENDSINEIYRATAVSYLGRFSSSQAMKGIEKELKNKSALIRQAAVMNYENPDKSKFVKALSPLLADSIKAIRIAVLSKVSIYPSLQFDPRYDKEYKIALEEYKNSMEYTADFPSSMYNLANLSIKSGNDTTAVKMLRESLRIDNMFYPSSVNLAILLSRNGNSKEAKEVLLSAVEKTPDIFDGHYYLGLLSVEENDNDNAIKYLTRALELQPQNSRVAYNIGLLYQKMQDAKNAEIYLLKAIEIQDNDPSYYYALAIYYLNTNQIKKVVELIDVMWDKFPESDYTQQVTNLLKK